MNYHKDNGLLNMIRRTDPMINVEDHVRCQQGIETMMGRRYMEYPLLSENHRDSF